MEGVFYRTQQLQEHTGVDREAVNLSHIPQSQLKEEGWKKTIRPRSTSDHPARDSPPTAPRKPPPKPSTNQAATRWLKCRQGSGS